ACLPDGRHEVVLQPEKATGQPVRAGDLRGTASRFLQLRPERKQVFPGHSEEGRCVPRVSRLPQGRTHRRSIRVEGKRPVSVLVRNALRTTYHEDTKTRRNIKNHPFTG